MNKTWKRLSTCGGIAVSLGTLAAALIYSKKREYRFYRKRKLNENNKDITFILIPDGGHGAWSYDRVVPYLKQAGSSVYALTLPGAVKRNKNYLLL